MEIKNQIIQRIKKYHKLWVFVNAIRFIQLSSLRKVDGSKKKYPKVIQLPITYNCNSRCVMCNIWQMDHSNEAKVDEFAKFMQDPLFEKVEAVGINGGEPSLVKDLALYAKEILKLPSLKALNIISHGFGTKPLLKSVENIYTQCKEKGIKFHVAISLDGFGEIHNIVRGRQKLFEKTITSIDTVIKDQSKYCDSYDIGCTVVQQNVDYLVELDTYAKSKNYNIKYRLGIENKRIESDKLKDQYSVLYSPLRQSAKEFFHYQFLHAKGLQDKFKYFAIHYWLNQSKPRRLLGCDWKEEGVTVDSRGELYYCAVASDSIGSLRQKGGEEQFFEDKNIEYRKSIIKNDCDGCIHDYSGKPETRSILIFLKSIVADRLSMNLYRLRLAFML
jgi:MoaA/NifB/PqqE/SkfB family radical SAM enzyme